MESHWMSPPYMSFKESNGTYSSAAVGHVFMVLAIITVLGVLAGLLGRACGGRHWAGETEYDFQGWVERKCAVCIDGEIETCEMKEDPKPVESSTGDVPISAADAVTDGTLVPAADPGNDQATPAPPEGEAKPPEGEAGEGIVAPPTAEDPKPAGHCEGAG